VAYLLSLVSFFFVTLLATVSRTPWYEHRTQDEQLALDTHDVHQHFTRAGKDAQCTAIKKTKQYVCCKFFYN
jgi:hypothetical protein